MNQGHRSASTLLPLTPLHAEIAAEIHRASFAEAWTAESIANLLSVPGTEGLVAVDDGNPAGMILFRIAADEAEILTLAVLPAARRSGLATSLLHGALQNAALRGARAVFLEVGEDNAAARTLYQTAGFEKVGKRPNYYAGPAGTAHADIYRLILPHPASTAVKSSE